MKYVIDKFENGLAVLILDDGSICNIPRSLVPDACEGDVIDISVDHNETKTRKLRIEQKLRSLFEEEGERNV